jgi:hypothetical protein
MKYTLSLLAMAFAATSAFASTPDPPSCDEWRLACSGNYTNASRPSSSAINYVIIHKVEGTASSAASWFQNCAAGTSAHFIFNNSTGYCYQSVYEADIAYHAGNWSTNVNSVGIEHGGFTASNDIATVCYNESAVETRSCIIYYTVKWDRSHIIGHSQVPGATHTDPGVYWNWTYYMSKCNPSTGGGGGGTNHIIDNSSAGFAASAGWATASSAADKYGADYRYKSTAAISDPATWTANLTAGNYDISAWWAQGSNRSTTAPYILPNGATSSQNQQSGGGAWHLLGTQALPGGNNVTKLSCWTTTGFVVVADAVNFFGPK